MLFVLNNKLVAGSIVGVGSDAIATTVVEKTCAEHSSIPTEQFR